MPTGREPSCRLSDYTGVFVTDDQNRRVSPATEFATATGSTVQVYRAAPGVFTYVESRTEQQGRALTKEAFKDRDPLKIFSALAAPGAAPPKALEEMSKEHLSIVSRHPKRPPIESETAADNQKDDKSASVSLVEFAKGMKENIAARKCLDGAAAEEIQKWRRLTDLLDKMETGQLPTLPPTELPKADSPAMKDTSRLERQIMEPAKIICKREPWFREHYGKYQTYYWACSDSAYVRDSGDLVQAYGSIIKDGGDGYYSWIVQVKGVHLGWNDKYPYFKVNNVVIENGDKIHHIVENVSGWNNTSVLCVTITDDAYFDLGLTMVWD
ncbi:hypothetical protein LMG27198_30230 [Methylocystis echinoides]|uniref:Uncharacterized protein n=1 Tax=Methylocystis echinoides TaxID=29468 RepID=A0A9W6GVV4_9HYPH|nr:hypothetical protein LMG27198_30230 [Methylocystis echinoides]